jgi:U3 small nucleolar RNA-associated protein 25
MQSLSSDSGPQSKRRKLDRPTEAATAKQEGEDWGEDDDALAEDADEVEEPEEGPDTTTDPLEEVEDSEDASDPFEAHFANPDDNLLTQRLRSIQQDQWDILKATLPQIGKAVAGYPHVKDSASKLTSDEASGPVQLNLKQKLANVMSKHKPSFDTLEKHIAPLIFNYQDVLYCERKITNSESLRRLACLHAVNHVYK